MGSTRLWMPLGELSPVQPDLGQQTGTTMDLRSVGPCRLVSAARRSPLGICAVVDTGARLTRRGVRLFEREHLHTPPWLAGNQIASRQRECPRAATATRLSSGSELGHRSVNP